MYFPRFYEPNIDCGQCDKEDCMCRDKHQRNRQDFSVTSGRCPKLPDKRGFVAKEEQENQRNAYPFVHVEIGEESVDLSISVPGGKKPKKVYRSGLGSWYYRTKDEDGDKIKRIIHIGIYRDYEDFISYGKWIHADYFLLPCEITDYLA